MNVGMRPCRSDTEETPGGAVEWGKRAEEEDIAHDTGAVALSLSFQP